MFYHLNDESFAMRQVGDVRGGSGLGSTQYHQLELLPTALQKGQHLV